MPPQPNCASQAAPAYSLGRRPSPHTAILPYAANLMISIPSIHVNTHLPTLEGRKAELADLQQIVYPQSSHLSTIDQAQVSENLAGRD